MMKNISKVKKYYWCIIAILIVTLFTSVFNLKALASAESIDEEKIETSLYSANTDDSEHGVETDDSGYGIEKITKDLLGDVTIEKSEYLYNLDDSADYIYVEFNNGGYAVFLKQTMEMLEYSARGKLDYAGYTSKKYYAGPSSYLIKEDDCFIDTISNQRVGITQELARQYSNSIRENLLDNYTTAETETVKYDCNLTDCTLSTEGKKENTSDAVGDTPVLDASKLIKIPDTNGRYIQNYQYFLHNPKHGKNSTGTCGAVATQLLLSYHNYYSDRRIIDNKFLNGSTTDIDSNPNLCADPMLMTSNTLGTRGTEEKGSDDANSYFSYVVSKIPSNIKTNALVKGIKNIFTERNSEISGAINYSVDSKVGDGFFVYKPVDISGVISEINAGRPSIILMQKSLGGSDHYVVAYGYCNYTYPDSTDSYSGFITHFGWEPSDINIWINSAWCYSYITLNIDHDHTYNKVGNIRSNPCRVESKCTVCGHRTDAYISIGSNARYTERTVSLPQNGYTYKDYIIKFDSAGIKLFQTFGSKDARLYLYDMQDNLLAYDDDDGYKYNSLFSCTVSSNTEYRIRVEFYLSSTTGNIKIGIMPIPATQERYEDISGPYTPGCSIGSRTYIGAMFLIRFNVLTEGDYIFYTENPSYSETITDMYLYLIDPTSTAAALYDDDGAGNLQAKISVTLKPGIEYLLIVTTYNIQSRGPFTLYF